MFHNIFKFLLWVNNNFVHEGNILLGEGLGLILVQ